MMSSAELALVTARELVCCPIDWPPGCLIARVFLCECCVDGGVLQACPAVFAAHATSCLLSVKQTAVCETDVV